MVPWTPDKAIDRSMSLSHKSRSTIQGSALLDIVCDYHGNVASSTGEAYKYPDRLQWR